MKITIDTDEIAILVNEADEIFIDPNGEERLLKLLEIEQMVKNAVDDAKDKLEAKALEINPNFRSIRGDLVKVSYRAFGSAYDYDEKQLDHLVEYDFIQRNNKYTLNTKAIKAYIKEVGHLPSGITPKPRPKKIVIKGQDGK